MQIKTIHHQGHGGSKRACLLLWRYEFESCSVLFCKLFEKSENDWKEAWVDHLNIIQWKWYLNSRRPTRFNWFQNVSGEYRNLVGESIPYRNFGFGNLQEFLQDAQNVCRVNFGPDGSAMVHGLGSEDTFHIHDMVKRQNSSKKLKPQRRPLNPQQQQWQPPTSDDYSNQTASGFRHGFRPVSFPGHQNGGFRPQMGANRYPDQVRK